MHHGFIPFHLSFFANPYTDANGQSWLQIWALDDLDPNDPWFITFPLAIRPIQRIGLTAGVVSATSRGQELVVALAESLTCGAPGPANITAIRVIIFPVLSDHVSLDRTFGRRSINDPANVDFVGYFQPAVEINDAHDIALVFWRYKKDVLPDEARYSVIYHGLNEQPASGLLQAGEGFDGNGRDTSGISLDPDDHAVWFVEKYRPASGLRFAIGRI